MSERRVVATLLLLAIAVGSIALGAKRDALLTLVFWGVVGVVCAGRAFALGRVKLVGAVAMVMSVALASAGLSLAAYGISHCASGGPGTTVDGGRYDFCSSRGTDPFYIAAGFVIALAGIASVRSVWRKPRLIGFFQAFVPIESCVLLFDVGYLGFFAASINVPALVFLALKSGSRTYKITCYLVAALTLARVGLLFAFLNSH